MLNTSNGRTLETAWPFSSLLQRCLIVFANSGWPWYVAKIELRRAPMRSWPPQAQVSNYFYSCLLGVPFTKHSCVPGHSGRDHRLSSNACSSSTLRTRRRTGCALPRWLSFGLDLPEIQVEMVVSKLRAADSSRQSMSWPPEIHNATNSPRGLLIPQTLVAQTATNSVLFSLAIVFSAAGSAQRGARIQGSNMPGDVSSAVYMPLHHGASVC
jgi:hypothetical protein